MYYSKLPSTFGILYSDLLRIHEGSFIDFLGAMGRGGTFQVRLIKGNPYVYYRFMDHGRQQVLYVGRETKELTAAISEIRSERQALADRRKALVATGAFVFDRESGQILRQLAFAGVFHAGAVLVGANAFLLYQNALGIRWNPTNVETLRTGDADIAQFSKFKVGTPLNIQDRLAEALAVLETKPLWTGLSNKAKPTKYRRAGDFDIEFLTPMIGPDTDKTVNLPWLGVSAQPLRFLDYVLEGAIRTVAFAGTDSFMVNVPDPARFALHKLIVSDRRAKSSRAKKEKDLAHACALLDWLVDNEPEWLQDAWQSLETRGPSWVHAAQTSFGKIPQPVQEKVITLGVLTRST